MGTLIYLFVLVAVIAWAVWSGGLLPAPYRKRSCQGKDWREAFPGATKQEIRSFLDVFVGAFAFSGQQKLNLSPDDRIWDIYRALYPHKWQADALEMETLAEDIRRIYDVCIVEMFSKRLTLGELFRSCVTPDHGAQPSVAEVGAEKGGVGPLGTHSE